MDDRHNFCDVCCQPILGYELWQRDDGDPVGPEDEIETPPGMFGRKRFGDGVIHARCLVKLIDNDRGAGI
jgi:hypothetical protein